MFEGQVSVGLIKSLTVTVALQVLALLLLSVTVKTTVLLPRSVQVKEDLLSDREATPHKSVELAPTMFASAVAMPELFS
jgi:hypothetical protein